ncbi:type VII secretion system-associated protein [Microbacterium sp.]|uniref:type VII secretion system-associated protein n=1 Tax=Microbacterium sp. TaxID=51671 RepID=UPI0039E609A3
MDSQPEPWGCEVTDIDTEPADTDATPPRPAPPITAALREEAKAHPGSWVYALDPGFAGSENVPPEGIVGAWQSDEAGEIGSEFMPNPRYRPTPQARGWVEPTTALERTLQLVLTGYLPSERLYREFAGAEVIVFDRDGGGFFVAPALDGGEVVYSYSDAARARASGHPDNRVVKGGELARALPDGVRIVLNPGEPASAVLEPSEVLSS